MTRQAAAPLSRRFWPYWVAMTTSGLANGMLGVSAPLLATHLTRRPEEVAGLTFFYTLPTLLFSLAGGVLVDRFDRRRLMLVATLGRAAVGATLAVGALQGWVTMTVLYGSALLLGTGHILYGISSSSILPQIVSRPQLERANSYIMAGRVSGDGVAGRPFGALLFTLGVSVPFLGYALAEMVSFGSLLALKESSRLRTDNRNYPVKMTQIADGFRWLFANQLLRSIVVVSSVANLAVGSLFSILVLYALDALGISNASYGVLMVALPLGGLVGASASGRIIRVLNRGGALRLAVGILVGSFVCLGTTSIPWLAATALFGLSAGVTVWNVVSASLRQAMVPDHLMGRVTSVVRLLSAGSQPLGAVLGGVAASTMGLRFPMLASAAVLAVFFVASMRTIRNKAMMDPYSAGQGTRQDSQLD